MDLCWKLGEAQGLLANDAAALQQSSRYGAAIRAMGGEALPFHLHDIASAQVVLRRTGRWGVIGLLSRGPVWRGAVSDRCKALALGSLRRALPGPGIRVLVATQDAGQAGLLPLYHGASVAEVELGAEPQMRRAMKVKWRNRLRRAEGARLKLEITRDPDVLMGLIQRDLAQQQAKRYRALSPKFIANWVRVAPQGFRVFRARMGREVVAELLVLDHAPGATYQIGWSSGAGRALNAQNLLLWQAMGYFAKKGRARLDLGLVDTVNAPGLARFKLGTGAKIRRLGATGLVLPGPARLTRHSESVFRELRSL